MNSVSPRLAPLSTPSAAELAQYGSRWGSCLLAGLAQPSLARRYRYLARSSQAHSAYPFLPTYLPARYRHPTPHSCWAPAAGAYSLSILELSCVLTHLPLRAPARRTPRPSPFHSTVGPLLGITNRAETKIYDVNQNLLLRLHTAGQRCESLCGEVDPRPDVSC